MKNGIKAAMFWTAFTAIRIAKLPIALVSALFIMIEEILTIAQIKLVKWEGSEEAIEAANMGLDLNINLYMDIAKDYLDMKIEL